MSVAIGEVPDGLELCVLNHFVPASVALGRPLPCVCLGFPRCTKSGCYIGIGAFPFPYSRGLLA